MSDTTTFLGYESSPLEKSVFSLIPVPQEEATTYLSGQARAPQAIFDASSQIENYDEETGLNLVTNGIHAIPPAAVPGLGLEAWVREQVSNAIDAVAVPILIGGDGSVTRWGVEALLGKVDEISILHIDAHADLNSLDGGANNLNTMRAILEAHANVHICQVGVRSLAREAFDLIVDDEKPVECLFMSDITRIGDDEEWNEMAIQELRSPVYLSIDLSALDPSILPNVANPEPGGLQWYQLLRLLKKVASRRRIAAVDLVELCPKDGSIVSDYTAAKLLYKTMNYIFSGGKMLEKNDAREAE